MPNTLNGVLANIPGLAGYEATRLNNQNTDMANMGLLQRIHAAAQQQALEEAKFKFMQEQAAKKPVDTFVLPAGATLMRGDNPVHTAPFKPDAPKEKKDIIPVTGGYLQQVDGKWTFTKTQQEPRQPLSERVVQDKSSPTGWSYEDAYTMKRRPGAPGPASSQPRPIPAPVKQALATNEGNVRRAQTALDLLNGKDVTMKGPDGKDIVLKGSKNATGLHRYAGETISQRINPEDADTLAAIGDLASMVIHDRSGAAVTAAEFPRLRPFIPTDKDRPDIARKKLARFVAEYTAINNELKGMFSKDQGFGEPEQDKVINFGDLK